MKIVSLQTKLSTQDYRRLSFGRHARYFYTLIIVCLLIPTVIIIPLAHFGTMGWAMIVTTMMCIVMPLSLADTATQPKYLLKHYHGSFTNPRIYEADDDGLMVRSESGSYGFIVWEDFTNAVYHKEAVLLFQSSINSYLIPDSAWVTPSDRDEFLDLLRTKSILK